MVNKVYILLGSNINPKKNIKNALNLLAKKVPIIKQSDIWRSEAFGSVAPDFYNVAVFTRTNLSKEEIKTNILQPIEQELGRKRSEDKYAPRTIDLDIIVFNHEILDDNLWKHNFIALPISQLIPNIKNTKTGESLNSIAERLCCNPPAIKIQRKAPN